MPEALPEPARTEPALNLAMRLLGVSLAIAVVVFVLTAGHVLFLPLVLVPLGLVGLGRRRQPRRRGF